MAISYGADTEALRTLADRFRDGSRRIDEIRSRLEPTVMDESIWQGGDADTFRTTWASGVSPSFGSVVEGVVKRQGDLDQQAEEQDRTSEPGDGSGDGGGGVWDTIMDVARIGSKAFSLYKASTTIMSGIDDMKRLADAAKLGPEDYARVMESLKLRNAMKFASEGFSKAFKTAGDVSGLPGLNHLGEWAGKKLDALPAKLGEGSKILDNIGAKLGPEGLSALGKGSRALAKFVPGADILLGGHQMLTADDGYGKVSGGLAVAGGALMAAGLVFPPLAVVGGVLSGASLAMDLIDMGGELFGVDPSEAVSDAVSAGVENVSDAVSDGADKVADAAGDLAGGIKDGLGSIF
ncbi:hypothetical protein [Brachybacterium sp. FME24]|uniref:hypothetical protein n=1 Tax=Brachybacterium sp. FME24 TaxID=2742605 RepID=UPI001868C206|nr:hypothetical protein [Brachybacterium sp. FME24]